MSVDVDDILMDTQHPISIPQISDLHEYNNYRRQLNAWEQERQRQLNEFTITENDLEADKRIPQIVDIKVGKLYGN